MDETKVHYHEEQVIDRPPSYSQAPPPGSSGPPGPPPPGSYGYTTGVSMVHAPIGVVGTNVGVVGTNVGIVGTNVGMVGPNVGVASVPLFYTQQISPHPARLTCKSCNAEILTRVESKPTWKTHFFATVLCLGGCWCCVCAPYFIDSCSNRDHYCPNCNAYIASYVI